MFIGTVEVSLEPGQNPVDVLSTTGELVSLGTQAALLELDETERHGLEIVLGIARQLLDSMTPAQAEVP